MRGLVLEGGGARGAYHIGVYKAILEQGIKIDGVTGTSIGALNGAMIVQDDFKRCVELWENIRYDTVINVDQSKLEDMQKFNINLDNIMSLGNQLKRLIKDKGLDISPFKKLLDQEIDEEKIRESDMDFGIVTVNVTDMEPVEIFKEDIPHGEIKNYLLASAYLPSFKSEKLGGKRYLDGAFYDNLPFSMLLDRGYNELILVRTHGTGMTKDFDKEDINAIVIAPSQDLGKGLKLESDSAKRNLKMGYYDALREFKNYRGNIYCIDTDKDNDFFFNFFGDLDNDKLEQLKEIFKIKDIPGRRALFEIIIPKIADELKLSKDYSYDDVLLGILEQKALSLDIDEFNIYELDEFINIIKNKKEKEGEKEIGALDKILDATDLSPIFNMEKLIIQMADIILEKSEILLLEEDTQKNISNKDLEEENNKK